jgi:hypothetical protein
LRLLGPVTVSGGGVDGTLAGGVVAGDVGPGVGLAGGFGFGLGAGFGFAFGAGGGTAELGTADGTGSGSTLGSGAAEPSGFGRAGFQASVRWQSSQVVGRCPTWFGAFSYSGRWQETQTFEVPLNAGGVPSWQ